MVHTDGIAKDVVDEQQSPDNDINPEFHMSAYD